MLYLPQSIQSVPIYNYHLLTAYDSVKKKNRRLHKRSYNEWVVVFFILFLISNLYVVIKSRVKKYMLDTELENIKQ